MKLIIIAGPTAAGKTNIAFQLAKLLNCEIIYADSRAIYKYMDIGTAKPSAQMRNEITHHMIDVVEPNEIYNTNDYATAVEKIIINKQKQNHKYIILTGGTGFYIKTYLDGIAPIPKIDPQVRNYLKSLFQEKGIKAIRKLLKEKDPKTYEIIDKNNPHRIIRALEVLIHTGKPITYFWNLPKKKFKIPELIYKIYVDIDRDTLIDNIKKRTDAMIQKGLIEETQYIIRKFGENLPALNTIGYKETIKFLKNEEYSVDNLYEDIVKNTIKYAKRQKTWFKKYYPFDIKITYNDNIKKIYDVIII